MCYSFVFPVSFHYRDGTFALFFFLIRNETNAKRIFFTNFRTKWNVCSQKKIETEPKQKEIAKNGTNWNVYCHSSNKLEPNTSLRIFISFIGMKWNVCFYSSKNQNKTNVKRICITNFGTKWNIYFYSSKKLEQNQSNGNFLYEFQSEIERFVLFQLHPRKRIDSP
jgi:hypothetical protein